MASCRHHCRKEDKGGSSFHRGLSTGKADNIWGFQPSVGEGRRWVGWGGGGGKKQKCTFEYLFLNLSSAKNFKHQEIQQNKAGLSVDNSVSLVAV